MTLPSKDYKTTHQRLLLSVQLTTTDKTKDKGAQLQHINLFPWGGALQQMNKHTDTINKPLHIAGMSLAKKFKGAKLITLQSFYGFILTIQYVTPNPSFTNPESRKT